MLSAFGITLLIIVSLVVAWHIAFPLLGGVIAIGAGLWALIVGSVVVMCGLILGLFVATGVGVILLGVAAFIFTLLAIILFPILFPILLPIFITILFISYFTRKKKNKHQDALPK